MTEPKLPDPPPGMRYKAQPLPDPPRDGWWLDPADPTVMKFYVNGEWTGRLGSWDSSLEWIDPSAHPREKWNTNAKIYFFGMFVIIGIMLFLVVTNVF